MDLTREEKLEIMKAAATLVASGLLEPSALEGFKLSMTPRSDPLEALSAVYDGIARTFEKKLDVGSE